MKGGFLVRNNTPSNTSVKEPVKARQRPLGLVRKVPSSSIESVPKFPPLKQAAERSYENLSATGNAIAVPPARESPDKLDPESRTSTSVSQHSHGSPTRKSVHSSKSTDSAATSMKSDEKTKEFKEALSRERQLKQQVLQLQKEIDELHVQVKDKDMIIQELQEKLHKQEQKYKELYENEKLQHEETKSSLDRSIIELDLAKTTISDMQRNHERETQELNDMMEQRLMTLQQEKDLEIASRDEKLSKLKKQMADALKGNSWERQQQLDELTKELSRIQDESDNLRFKLKSLQKSKGSAGGCSNCESVQSKLSLSQRSIKDRDSTIKNLEQSLNKFEKQISEQDLMLKKFAEQNGRGFVSRK